MENYELSSNLQRINFQVDHLERKIDHRLEMSGREFERKIDRNKSDINLKISMLEFKFLGLTAVVILLNFLILSKLDELLPN